VEASGTQADGTTACSASPAEITRTQPNAAGHFGLGEKRQVCKGSSWVQLPRRDETSRLGAGLGGLSRSPSTVPSTQPMQPSVKKKKGEGK